MSRKDLVPAVPYSWFPGKGTRGEHTWGLRATKRSWTHVAGGEVLEFVMEAVYSFCPLKKEHWSALGRSWDCANCCDGDSCGWAIPTISTSALRVDGSKDRNHLLLRHLLFGLDIPTNAAVTPVGLVRQISASQE